MKKPLLINLDGKIVSANEPVFHADERVLRYGDGLFESMRVIHGRIPFWQEHYERLYHSAVQLQLPFGEKLSPTAFQKELQYLLGSNGIHNGRLRFMLYRKGRGFYGPESMESGYLIEAEEMPEQNFPFNVTGLQTGIYTANYKSCSSLSNIKTNNALIYVLASVYCKQQLLDECLLINQKGFICESISSNVFIMKGDQLITPSLKQGCVKGVMRQLVLGIAADMKLKVSESLITLDDLDEASEMFFTNAVLGIRWASSCHERVYGQEISALLSAELNRRFN